MPKRMPCTCPMGCTRTVVRNALSYGQQALCTNCKKARAAGKLNVPHPH